MSFLISDGYKKRTLELDERDRFDYWRDIICDEFVKLDCEKMETGNLVGVGGQTHIESFWNPLDENLEAVRFRYVPN